MGSLDRLDRTSIKPLVSVIIPTHDRVQLLKEALASVEAQYGVGETFEIEVIVVDDASAGDASVIRDLPRTRYIRLATNRGLAAARNIGIEASRGQYLAFLDDDDLWLPCKLERQIKALECHPEAGVVYSPCIVRSGHQEFLIPAAGRAPFGEVLEHLLEHNLAPVHSFLVRRELIDAAGKFDERLQCFEDHDLWIRLAVHTPFLFDPQPVGIYRLSPGGMNLTQHAGGGAEQASRRILEKMLAFLPETDPYSNIRLEVSACLKFQIACSLIFNGKEEAGRPYLQAAMRRFLSTRQGRYTPSCIPRIAGVFSAASTSPITMTKALSKEIRDAAGPLQLKQRSMVNRLLADLWGQVANDLGFGSLGNDRDAGRAAVYALLRSPSALRYRKSLAWLIIRGIAGRRFDPVLGLLQKKVHRLA